MVIRGAYFHDIQAQPQALQDTLADLAQLPALDVSALTPTTPLVLTGMGASLAALVPLQLHLVAAGYTAIVIDTGELVHHGRGLLRPGARVIAVSQSGRSAETVRLLDLLPADVPVIGVTNDAASPLAKRAQQVILTRAGAEATVSCKTYVSALVALSWLGAQLTGEDLSSVGADLAAAPTAVASYLAGWQAHVDELVHVLAGKAQIYYAGRGPSLAAAQAAGLITKEAVHFPAEGMSSAAFRHGPLEMVGPTVFLLVFEGVPATAELNRKLVDDVRARGGGAALCGVDGTGAFALPSIPPRLLPIAEILVPQMITLALGARLEREAGRFSHATKVTAVE